MAAVFTDDRGARTDHGGGRYGEDWMTQEQIETHAAPFRKKWQPIIDKIVKELKLKKYHFKSVDGVFEYGEKGHISFDINIDL